MPSPHPSTSEPGGLRRVVRRAPWAGPVALLAIVATIAVLLALPARRATAAFPPGFENFEGSILVADNDAAAVGGGPAILRINPTNCAVLQTFAVGFDTFNDLRVHPQTGNIYVGTNGDDEILVFDPMGTPLFASDFDDSGQYQGFDDWGFDVEPDGTVWLPAVRTADLVPVILHIARPNSPFQNAVVLQEFSLAAAGPGTAPFDVAVDEDGHVFITDDGAVPRVLDLDTTTGNVATVVSPVALVDPRGIEHIHEPDGDYALRVVDPGGALGAGLVVTFATPGGGAATVITPMAPAFPVAGAPKFTATPRSGLPPLGDRTGADFWVNRNQGLAGAAGSGIQRYGAVPFSCLNPVPVVGSPFGAPQGLDIAIAPPTGGVVVQGFDVTDTLDFGPLCPGETRCREVTVSNTSAVPIQVVSFGSLIPPFELEPGPAQPFTLAPGQTETFTLCFTAPATGPVADQTISLVSNDPFGPPTQTFTVRGSVEAVGTLSLTGCDLNFGRVKKPSNARKSRTFAICNRSDTCDLRIESIGQGGVGAPIFTVHAPTTPFTLPPGHCVDVRVMFNPRTAPPKTLQSGAVEITASGGQFADCGYRGSRTRRPNE